MDMVSPDNFEAIIAMTGSENTAETYGYISNSNKRNLTWLK